MFLDALGRFVKTQPDDARGQREAAFYRCMLDLRASQNPASTSGRAPDGGHSAARSALEHPRGRAGTADATAAQPDAALSDCAPWDSLGCLSVRPLSAAGRGRALQALAVFEPFVPHCCALGGWAGSVGVKSWGQGLRVT